MKRRFVLGCLVFVVLLLVGGGAAAYFYVVRPAMGTINAAKDLTRLNEMDAQVRNRRSFSAPKSGELTSAQVERYLGVTRSVTADLQERASHLERRFEEIDQDQLGPRQLLNAYSEIIKLLVSAKESQVAALNQHGFSVDEYAWVRTQVIQASGHPFEFVDLARLAEGDADAVTARTGATVPPANVELVSPYADELESYLTLAAFGL